MRTLATVMLVLAVWCEIAYAKPKVAILGLELIVSGAKADPKSLQIAAQLTESLRAVPRGGVGKFELAPNSNRELIDEKFAANCETEKPACMAPIGTGLGTDHLIYGNIAPASENGSDGFRVSLKLLDVTPKTLAQSSTSFVPLSSFTGGGNAVWEWARQEYAKLTGDPAVLTSGESGLGQLVINANVKRGDVIVDNEKKGRLVEGTLTLTLPEASYEVAIEAPGYKRYAATVTVVGGETKTATAELEPEPATAAPAPKPMASPLTLGKGKLLIAGSTVNLDISDTEGFDDPGALSFAPSVWYGVTEELTVGLTHDFGTTAWTPRPASLTSFSAGTLDSDSELRSSVLGGGLCVTDGCPESYKTKIYNSTGADLLYSLKQGSLSLAAHPGIDITVRYPFVLDVRIGVLGRYAVNDRFSVVVEPRLRLGVIGNDDEHNLLDLPIWNWFAVNEALGLYLHTGLSVPLDGFTDEPFVLLQVGANYKIGQKLALGLDFGFRNVNDVGDDFLEISGFAGRALGLRISYAP
jgi:hypothetical protein